MRYSSICERRLAIAGPQRGDPAAHLALLSQFRAQGSTLPEAEALSRLLARDPAFLAVRGQVLDGRRSSVLPFRIDGRNYLGMISPLHGVNALDLEMADALMMPVDPLLAPFRNLQRAILAVGAAGLVVALALSLRSARKVTAPLKTLAAAAQSLAEGDPPESLGLEPTADEVGVLTRTFEEGPKVYLAVTLPIVMPEARLSDEVPAVPDSLVAPVMFAAKVVLSLRVTEPVTLLLVGAPGRSRPKPSVQRCASNSRASALAPSCADSADTPNTNRLSMPAARVAADTGRRSAMPAASASPKSTIQRMPGSTATASPRASGESGAGSVAAGFFQ